MKLEETGWRMLAEGTKWEHAESKMVLLEESRPLDELLTHMLANSCGGHNWRVKDGELYSQEIDDHVYNSHPWREDWEAKGWTIATDYAFDLAHNNPRILVSYKWSPEDADGDRELIGAEMIGYAFNYC